MRLSALLGEGDGIALSAEDGRRISRTELAAMVADFAAEIGGGRRLVLLACRNDLDTVVAYLACLAGGHPVIVSGPDHQRLEETFAPDLVISGRRIARHERPARDFHPDLAVLLSTSGSTGSPKLVRLSQANILANARSIADYLVIAPDDRAITSLPIHYSYGLSVLNSHLIAGASLVLTDMSVTEPAFWSLFRKEGVTSIAGVPYSYELFERMGLRDNPPPTLRTMTQAGGRLPPDLVRRYAAFATAHGIRFFVMYGQTEATARMAYLPPELAETHADCIGVAIPGGSFSLREGELVYRGPNVMMGYATAPEDLARGPELSELATGDLASCDAQGIYRITGRASRFAKIAGLRIGFDDVEALLAREGVAATVAGDDEGLAICVTGGADAGAARDLVAARCHLPVTAIATYAAKESPRLPSGKPDFPAIKAAARARAPELDHGAPIAALLARITGRKSVGPQDSFASLGGDSLSYVEASLGIEQAIGNLPANWETMTIAELEGLAAAASPPRVRRVVRIEGEVLLRVLAILLVIIGHAAPAQTEFLRGGSGILMMLAGYNLARFQSANLIAGQAGVPIRGTFMRVILPYLLLMALMLPMSHADWSIGWPLLVSTFTVDFRGPLFAYWFIETVFHALLILSALFLIPPVRRLAADRPLAFAIGLILFGAALHYGVPLIWTDGREKALTVDAWFYVYAMGWGLRSVKDRRGQALIFAIGALLLAAHWGPFGSRALWPVGAAVALLLVPTLRVPAQLASGLKAIAGDSYFIYLVHVIVVHLVIFQFALSDDPLVRILLVIGFSLAAGLAYARGWRLATAMVRS